MLRTTPFHRESYSRLILTVIVQFYQRCSDKFQDLVSIKNSEDSEGAPRLALAAQWTQRSELTPCLTELCNVIEDAAAATKRANLCRQETHLESNLLGERTVGQDELVRSTRSLSTLTTLYHSVVSNQKCFILFPPHVLSLDMVLQRAEQPQVGTGGIVVANYTSQARAAERSHSLYTLRPGACSTASRAAAITSVDGNGYVRSLPQVPFRLVLTQKLRRFQALQKTYEQLSESILHTARVDIRCRVWHHLDLALRHVRSQTRVGYSMSD